MAIVSGTNAVCGGTSNFEESNRPTERTAELVRSVKTTEASKYIWDWGWGIEWAEARSVPSLPWSTLPQQRWCVDQGVDPWQRRDDGNDVTRRPERNGNGHTYNPMAGGQKGGRQKPRADGKRVKRRQRCRLELAGRMVLLLVKAQRDNNDENNYS